MTKLVVAFRNFANAPKNELSCDQYVSLSGFSMLLEIRMKMKMHYLLNYLTETRKPEIKAPAVH